MDDFERAWRKQLAAEKKYIDERSRRSDSRLNRFLQTKVPEKLKDMLDTGFAKAFELIFAKGTGVIEKNLQPPRYRAQQPCAAHNSGKQSVRARSERGLARIILAKS